MLLREYGVSQKQDDAVCSPRIIQLRVRSLMMDALEFSIPIYREGEAKILVAAAPVLASCAFNFVDRVFRVEVTFGDSKIVDVLLDPVEFITFGIVTNMLRSFWPRTGRPLRIMISSASDQVISPTLLRSLVSGLTLTFYNLTDEDGRSSTFLSKAATITQIPKTLVMDVRVHVPKVLPRNEGGEPILRVNAYLFSNIAFDDCKELFVSVQDVPSFLAVADDQSREGSYSIERCAVESSKGDDRNMSLPSSIARRTTSESVLVYRDVRRGQLCGAIFERVDSIRPHEETLETALDNLFFSESQIRKSNTIFGHVRLRVCRSLVC